MPGYRFRNIEHAIGSQARRLRVLVDTRQFADPDGQGERIGISSAQWSLFGQAWPARRLSAQTMHRVDIDGKPIMALGRGDSARCSRLLAAQGFEEDAEHCPMDDADQPPHPGRMLHCRRRSLQ